MIFGDNQTYVVTASRQGSDARAIARSAYARLAMAVTIDVEDGLLVVWRRAACKSAPETPALSSRFLRMMARIGSFAFSVALHLEQGSIVRERAELRYFSLGLGRMLG